MPIGSFIVELIVGTAADLTAIEAAERLKKKYGWFGCALGVLLAIILLVGSIWLIIELTT